MRKFKGAGWKPAGWKPTASSRSNTTPSAIRGKISAPIPINVNDDEFPIRLRGNSIVTPLGVDAPEPPLRFPTTPLRDEKAQLKEEGEIPAPLEEASMGVQSAPISMASSHVFTAPPAGRMTLMGGSGVLYPAMSSTDRLQRKKSTLRSVLGRFFGKKRKSGSSTTTAAYGYREDSTRAEQHRSDPSALRKKGEVASSQQQRSTSMPVPVNEYGRALSSHVPLVMDVHAEESTKARSLNELEEEAGSPRGAATGRVFHPTRTLGHMNWTGLSPRPASSHARYSRMFADGSQGPIGFAVTSGSHPKRRSRSAGNFHDTTRLGLHRRRSDEIRYWRESYDPDAMSPMSSQHKPDLSVTRGSNLLDGTEVPEAPEPFNFGELAGMKITQAAGLESRVSTLEARLERMEKAVGHLLDRRPSSSYASRPKTGSSDQSLPRPPPNRMYLQAHNPQADTLYGIQAPAPEGSQPSTISTQPSYLHSYEELSPRPAYQSSPEPPPDVPSSIFALRAEFLGRPLSTSTTIRAVASSSPTQTPPNGLPLSKTGSLTAHHYGALLNLITAEQAARGQLEAQVAALQKQVQQLLSLSKPTGDDGSVYSEPAPRPQNIPDHRKTMGMRGEFSSFEHEESGRDSGSELDEGTSMGGRISEETYSTPNEERAQYRSSDEYEHEGGESGRRVSEPRTLSLSQLTMGRTALASVGF